MLLVLETENWHCHMFRGLKKWKCHMFMGLKIGIATCSGDWKSENATCSWDWKLALPIFSPMNIWHVLLMKIIDMLDVADEGLQVSDGTQIYRVYRDQFGYGLSQWEKVLHGNTSSNWLIPYLAIPKIISGISLDRCLLGSGCFWLRLIYWWVSVKIQKVVLPIDIENPYRLSNCLYRYISGS